MSCHCCGPAAGAIELFGRRQTRRDIRRFRRHGLDRRARRLIDAVERAAPLEGARTLEVGAGIGALSLTLLERGVARADAVDASPAAADAARGLAAERNVADRFEMRIGDFAEMHTAERYDAVILDRVVCCYPDWQGLLAPAAESARHVVAMTYPRDIGYTRLGRALLNGVMAILRRRFRFFIHPPAAMHDALRRHGLEPRMVGHERGWALVVATRPAVDDAA